jgi:hypothetical protein
VIEEYISAGKKQAEPAYRTEMLEERRRREQLERRVNELVEENRRSKQQAEESERSSQIRAELQRLGVTKVDLAFRVVKDEIVRGEDGSLVAKTAEGDRPWQEHLSHFVEENPEFLPARIQGGSGAWSPQRNTGAAGSIDLDKIRPGMNAEDLQRVREQVTQALSHTLRGE